MISLIIPTYNNSKTVIQAIDSVLKQNIENLELIVVDDGSTDRTEETLKSYIDSGAIQYFYKPNGGASSARNLGIQNASNEFICFLDADDELLEGSLFKRIQFLKEYPEVGLVFTDYIKKTTETGRSTIQLRDQRFLQKFEPAVVKRDGNNYIFGEKFFDMVLKYNTYISTCCAMLRRSVIDKVGLFNVNYAIAEDIDYWIRAINVTSVGYIDEPLFVYNNYQSYLSKQTDLFYKDSDKFWVRLFDLYDLSFMQKYFLRRKIAKILFDYGYYYAVNIKTLKSREKFIQSFKWWPFDHRVIKSILVSFLPNTILKSVFSNRQD